MTLKRILPIAAAVGAAWLSGCGEGVAISDTPPPLQGPQREEPPQRVSGVMEVGTEAGESTMATDYVAGPDRTIGTIKLRALNQRGMVDEVTLTNGSSSTATFGSLSLWNGANLLAEGAVGGKNIRFKNFAQTLSLGPGETTSLSVKALLLGPIPSDFTLSVDENGVSAHDTANNELFATVAANGTFPMPFSIGRVSKSSLYAKLSAASASQSIPAGTDMAAASFDLTPYGANATLDSFDLSIALGPTLFPWFIKNLRVIDETGASVVPPQASITSVNPAAQYTAVAYAVPATSGRSLKVVFDFSTTVFIPNTLRVSLQNIRATGADGTAFTIANLDGNTVTITR